MNSPRGANGAAGAKGGAGAGGEDDALRPLPPVLRLLAADVLIEACTLLDAKSLATAAGVCRSFREVCQGPYPWRHQCAREWALPLSEESGERVDSSGVSFFFFFFLALMGFCGYGRIFRWSFFLFVEHCLVFSISLPFLRIRDKGGDHGMGLLFRLVIFWQCRVCLSTLTKCLERKKITLCDMS